MNLKLRTYFVLVFIGVTFLSSANEKLAEAKSHFDAKQYKQSLALYESLIDSSKHSSNLYYNIALCHKEMGNLGLSLWYAEKALLYQPYHRQSNALLAQQNELVQDDLDLSTEFSAFNKISRGLRDYYLFIFGISFSLIGAFFLFIGVKNKKSSYNFFALLSALLVGITVTMLWVQKQTFSNSGYGIVMEDCVLKEKSDSESNDSFSVSEGLKLQIVDENNDWYRVQVKKQHAYIPKSYLKKI